MFLDRMKTLALIASTGFGAAAVAGMAVPRGEEAGPPPAVAAGPDAGKAPHEPDPRFSKRMRNGALVEVVAASRAPGTGGWWRPDGTPLAEPPCDPMDNLDEDGRDGLYQILYRVTDVSEHRVVHLTMGANAQDQFDVRRDGKIVPGLRLMTASYRGKWKTGILGVSAEYGPWETLVRWSPAEGTAHANSGPRGRRTIHNWLPGGQGRTIATMAHEFDQASSAFQLSAIDGRGREIRGADPGGLDNGAFSMLWKTFESPPEQIQEIRFQSRPREQVFINRIALHPNKPVPPR